MASKLYIQSMQRTTTIKIEYDADNDPNMLPGNLDVKASIKDPHEDVEEGQFLHMKEPDESVDSEDKPMMKVPWR